MIRRSQLIPPLTPPPHCHKGLLRIARLGGLGGVQVGVQLADGRQLAAKAVISNATRWDTFGGSECDYIEVYLWGFEMY